MQKNIIIALSGGGLSAIASVAFLMGAPGALFFAYIAALPIFIIAFSLGPVIATVASLSGFVFAGLLGGATTAAMYGILHALPAWIVSRQSLSQIKSPDGKFIWCPAGNILSSLSLLCAGCMCCAGIFFIRQTESLIGLVSEYLRDAFVLMAPSMTNLELQSIVQMLVSIFPGAMGASWILMLVINALIAQSIVVKLGYNVRPNPSLLNMSLPQWFPWPMVVMAAISLVTTDDIRYITQNMAIILAVPYFFLGTSMIHWAVRRSTLSTPLLVGFYFILLIFGWAILVVTAIGMAEQWANLRNRFSVNKHN